MRLGEVDLSNMLIDARCRDDIPKILLGLQYIYNTPHLRIKVYDLLLELLPKGTDCNNGRPGMNLWSIFVLGVLRLNLNADYDRIHDLANNHKLIRTALGESNWGDTNNYRLQTIRDNVALFTPEILDRISRVVVDAGHDLVGKSSDDALHGRCDSSVLKTDVHYPTDINLLFDAIRKVIVIIASMCMKYGLDWGHSGADIQKAKMLFRIAQRLKASSGKDDKKKAKQKEVIAKAHEAYIEVVVFFLEKARAIKLELIGCYGALASDFERLDRFMAHAERQIDQIRRRVLNGEMIPHDEKVFSLFEEYTEWISKGKAGVPVELGLRICVVEDQYGFILHHEVMQGLTDDKVAVSIIAATKARFPALSVCSFDKGFYTPQNKMDLQQELDFLVMPKKGKLSQAEREVECSARFKELRNKHSAVESAINALQVHGMDVCPDLGIVAFKRYAAMAVLARNIQQIGEIIRRRAVKLEIEERQLRRAA
jgi:IS5 family transposase